MAKDALDELWCELETLAELYLPPPAREAWLKGQDELMMALETGILPVLEGRITARSSMRAMLDFWLD